ncbi:MAG: hypothetical protein A2173_04655 [Planctomycetes bacterium RBG_13_44_8b]|nr:MAG: hypothetical protein A2173_04655 [Planctomycetes bacterium RBG_13_44_8b]
MLRSSFIAKQIFWDKSGTQDIDKITKISKKGQNCNKMVTSTCHNYMCQKYNIFVNLFSKGAELWQV